VPFVPCASSSARLRDLERAFWRVPKSVHGDSPRGLSAPTIQNAGPGRPCFAVAVTHLLLEALREERIERVRVAPDTKLTLLILGDVERWAEGFNFPAEEVRRSFDATRFTFMPFSAHGLIVFGVGAADTMRAGHAGKHVQARDVAALLEERIPQGKADGFSGPVVSAVSGSDDREGRQGCVRKLVKVEVTEKVRRRLCAQGLNVLCGARSVEWCPVDEFEGPGPHAHDIIASKLVPPPDH